MFAYVALGGLESYLPQVDRQPSPSLVSDRLCREIVVVAALAWWYRYDLEGSAALPEHSGVSPWPTLTGLLVTGLWVGLDGLYPSLPFMMANAPRSTRTGCRRRRDGRFIVVRMLGLVVLVPLIEELFWRSFLIRWLIDQDFPRVPIGAVTPLAAVVTSVLFALAHPEWLPALLTGLLWAWLLRQTKSLGACVVSHAVANLALGVYVIASGTGNTGNRSGSARHISVRGECSWPRPRGVGRDDHPLGHRRSDLSPADRHDRADRPERTGLPRISPRAPTKNGRWSSATASTRSSG